MLRLRNDLSLCQKEKFLLHWEVGTCIPQGLGCRACSDLAMVFPWAQVTQKQSVSRLHVQLNSLAFWNSAPAFRKVKAC